MATKKPTFGKTVFTVEVSSDVTGKILDYIRKQDIRRPDGYRYNLRTVAEMLLCDFAEDLEKEEKGEEN